MNGLIIIPAYNEEPNIGATLDALLDQNYPYDIIVVNDGSNDNTKKEAFSHGAKVLDLPFNLGYGGALQAGFKWATQRGYDFVITYDADGQHNAGDIRIIEETIKRQNVDLIIGSRFLHPMEYRTSLLKKNAIWIFKRMTSVMANLEITDPTSGFQALSKQLFTYLSKKDNYPMDYPDVNVLIDIKLKGYSIEEVPVSMQERIAGKSMHNNITAVPYALQTLLDSLIVYLRNVLIKPGDKLN